LCSARRLGFKDLNLSFRYLEKGPGLSLALPAAKLGFSSAILSLPPPAGTARRHYYPTQHCMPAGSFWGPQSTIAEMGI
jgi:hypothetical protein